MKEFLRFALLGLGLGGIYALAAQGLVLVYRGSGVLNFAHGAIAAVAAYVYVATRDGLGTWGAVTVGTMAGGALGVAVHGLIMRPLRDASPLTRLVATLGVLTVIQASLLGWPLHLGEKQRFVQGFLPDDPVRLPSDVTVSADRLWITAIAVLLSIGLWAAYRFLRFGVATRAVAENQDTAAAVGISPDVVAAANWGLGGALAGFAGILVVPIVGLSVNEVLLLLVPSLAAALVGRFVSFPLTLLGAVVIGILESELTSGASWIPPLLRNPGWSKSVPFLVIIAVLVVGGRSLPVRGHAVERMPRAGGGRFRPVAVVVAAAVAFVLLQGAGIGWVEALTTTLTGGTVALSLVVVTGYTGQLSLAQYSLAGVGAYVAARAAAGGELVGAFSFGRVGFEVAILLGIAVAVPVGLLVGLPAVRTRGVNLAVATLGLALLIERVVLANPEYTGGFEGTAVGSFELFGIGLDPVSHPRRYGVFCLVAFTVAAVVVANLRRGRAGRRLLAVRANERAAASLGISVVGAKLYAFGLAAAIAALGGILLAFRTRTVLFAPYNLFNSIQVVVQTVLGGIGHIPGALFGAALGASGFISHALHVLLELDQLLVVLLAGLLLVVNLVVAPDGMVPNIVHLLRRLAGGRRRAAGPVVPEAADGGRERVRPQTLRVSGATVRFGGVVALDDVSLAVEPGRVLGLIGPNGAGKSTLIDLLTGFNAPERGTVELDGHDVTTWSPHRRARAGVGRSFQSLELFDDMTVLDNIRTASDRRDRLAYLSDLVWPRAPKLGAAALAAVQDFELVDDLHRFPPELSYGRRRLVGIARAVAALPSVLLLDEPAAGLDETETRELGRLIRRLADEWGCGVLLVEHDVSLVMRVCDHVVVLDFGREIASGEPEEVRRSREMIRAYLGEDDEEEGQPLLSVPDGDAGR